MNRIAKHCFSALGSLLMLSNLGFAADNVPPSKMPPNGLLPHQVPMFVTIGFDDNEADDAMVWITDYVKNMKNPTGDGNPGTYDGSDVRFTFFQTTQYIDCNVDPYCEEVIASWNKAYNEGHEIGNHTISHPHGASMSVQGWLDEIGGANQALTGGGVQQMSVPTAELRGYRNPFLEQNANTYVALQQLGMEYDSSIQDGAAGSAGGISDGTDLYWPYTMDNGSPSFPNYGTAPGLWEMPAYPVFRTNGSSLTGFDYNMWFPGVMTRAEFTDTLKHTLDLRMAGNRAPMLWGAHTGEYTPYSGSQPGGEPDPLQRRAAIEDFIQYALSIKVNGQSVVRIVPYAKILDWMKNPVPLFPVLIPKNIATGPQWEATDYPTPTPIIHNGVKYINKWYASAGEVPGETGDAGVWRLWETSDPDTFIYGGTISPSEPVDMVTGGNQTFTITPNAGQSILDVKVDGVSQGAISTVSFTNVTENHTIEVQFGDGSGLTHDIIASSGVNGSITPSGTVAIQDQADATFVIDADAGYRVAGITVDGTSMAAAPSYTFNSVTSGHTIHATFDAVQTYTIDASVSTVGGAISPVGIQSVQEGGDVTFSIAAEYGFRTVDVVVDGVSQGVITTYPFSNVTANHTISASFEAVPMYNVHVGIIGDGFATPAQDANGNLAVVEGGSVLLEFIADSAASRLKQITVDGVVAPQGNYYNVTNVVADVNVVGEFEATPIHTITSSVAGGNGTVSPLGATSVYEGTVQRFDFTPAPGYKIKRITVDGVDVAIADHYGFSTVDANHTIVVEYELDNSSNSTVNYSITQDWGSGFGADVTITNTGTTTMSDWSITWTWPSGQSVGSLWNASYTQTGSEVTVTNVGWNADIAPGASVSFGFNGSYPSTNTDPTVFTVNCTECQ